MRDYLAELTEYAKRAAPICGYHPAILTQRVSPDHRVEKINAALCESHLMDWLAKQDVLGESVSMSCVSGHCFINGKNNASRLLALIAAVEATKPDHISDTGNMVERGAVG